MAFTNDRRVLPNTAALRRARAEGDRPYMTGRFQDPLARDIDDLDVDKLLKNAGAAIAGTNGRDATGGYGCPSPVPLVAIGPPGFHVDHRGQPVEWTPPRANPMPPRMADAEFNDPAIAALTWVIALALGFLCGAIFGAGYGR